MNFGHYSVDIKNKGKVFFPKQDITKGDLIDYYDKIADHLLPFLKDRPLTLSRFPDGIEENGFYQKEVPDYFPDWIKVLKVKKKEGGSILQLICNNKATLIYLVNQGTLSFHPWLSSASDLDKPNKLTFDLDPPNGHFDLVIKGAKALRSLLEDQLDLSAFVMTTGSEGLHVVTPIQAKNDFEEVHAFAKQIVEYLASQQPKAFTTAMRKENRNGKLFLDYLRNAYAQTSIVPYSVRALQGAPVATPLTWDELNNEKLTSQSYHIKNIFKRLSQKDDIWNHFRRQAKDLKNSIEALEDLMS